MRTIPLHDQFHSWLLSTYNDPEFAGRVHCFNVRRRVALAPGETLDFVSVRHEAIEDRGAYSVGLWKFIVGAIDLGAVNEMCRHLQSFRSGCAEALNRREMRGESGLDSVGVYANLVGARVSAGAATPLLANGFGDLSFWTYRQGINRIEVEPYYDESSTLSSQTRLFRKLFETGTCSGLRRKGKPLQAASPA
jgi:hypothetical protein